MERVRNKIHGNHNPYEGFSPLSEDLQGWSSTSEAFKKCIDQIKPKLIIEVGTWKGASAIHMAKTCFGYYNDFEIVCVDTFLGSWEHWTTMADSMPIEKRIHGRCNVYEQFLSNVIINNLTDNITPFAIDSINGALSMKQWSVKADMIYVDAGHDYDSVYNDLLLYRDLLRPGGFLLGDDWFHPPIKQAVEDVLGEVQTLSHDKFLWIHPG